MKQQLATPPRWAESVLERILADADRQTVPGDLREEFAEVIQPARGRLKANLWYLRQVLSLAGLGVSQESAIRRALLLASVFTFSCSCWLAVMEWLLRHPGHLLRSTVDFSIALVPLATMVVLILHLGIRAERWLWPGAVALIAVAVKSLLRNARATHFEGFVLLISLVLAVQGVFMLLSLGRTGSRRWAPGAGEAL